jgi:hypothetical protein
MCTHIERWILGKALLFQAQKFRLCAMRTTELESYQVKSLSLGEKGMGYGYGERLKDSKRLNDR